MANVDFSKYSDEELERIASGTNSQPQASEEPGFFKKLGQGYLNYAGGALRGMGQAAGDLGASALNAPISGLEYLSGHKIPHVPHPNLINKNPGSLGESVGQILGQFTGGMALPGGAGLKAAQLAGKGYSALRAGKQLPLIGKLLAGGAGGAAEGAIGNEENRTLGAEIGGLLGGGVQAGKSAINFAKSIKPKNIAKDINKIMDFHHEQLGQKFEHSLNAGEEAGANKFLKPQSGNVKLLKSAGENIPEQNEKKLTYALEQYNKNPTLTNAHHAQRDINKLVYKFSGAQKGTEEYAAHKEALKIKNNLLAKISEAFEKSGAGEHGENYANTRIDYRKTLGPYLDVPEIRALRRGDIRDAKFADAFLNKTGQSGPQEKFMKGFSKEHPGLQSRETTKKVLGNPVTQKALGGAALLGGAYLPYEIAKLLGLR
ncbi:hypothetical protein UFOVP260_38 [uncultured Caudovirales phage]|uniref:Uncharacterized protein n=1 Tax=uncultured Caudovirales phage TaxID=2100421 RepID=A0A6J5LDH1_9CAUD|nr:hypothetical protein UFOVP85_24 [uncultured Caudovirales phage]CAB4132574.1 hypothetical protein UFOVP260_38 [uncultured Caudovirales phage]CAB4202384.1 hypothetical protein UFOVP1363_7 [uncultured Caudovirales phage]CAB5207249.1 hypothetical protein UFOVP179_41 [uncultured Caudovirales phage]